LTKDRCIAHELSVECELFARVGAGLVNLGTPESKRREKLDVLLLAPPSILELAEDLRIAAVKRNDLPPHLCTPVSVAAPRLKPGGALAADCDG
jgi:hypothetical protein